MARKKGAWIDEIPIGKPFREQDMNLMRMDVKQLVDDLGGPTAVGRITEKWHSSVIAWTKQEFVDSRILAMIKRARPEIDLNRYFK